MPITVRAPAANDLGPVVAALASWQREGAPVQLHPGDLGWHWRLGADAVADALRVWTRGDELVAVGLVDRDPAAEVTVIRMALAPSVDRDDGVASALVADLEDPAGGVLPAGVATVEARAGQALRSLLDARGWQPDEAWTPLVRDLTAPVVAGPLRVETVGPSRVADRVTVQLAAFPTSTFTTDRWHTMVAALPYRQARCLVGYADEVPVATVTVWSAGPGRPGLLEPMGVHREHRGHGHGTGITLAAAAALRELGASSATVATPAANTAAVATYRAAGYGSPAEVTDFRRPA